jgi:hypothetical protein
MKNSTRLLLLIAYLISFGAFSQVKSSYLYNTSMPYGVLDLRTKISSSNYFYLKEGQTFSYRESSPGVRTNTYRDMTGFESNPYKQGHLRHKNGTKDIFKMNYRLLMPVNYKTTYAEGYPLIVLLHGAGERGNCLYNSCYHSNFSYDPNVNSPAAPKTVDHRLLNNDHNLNIGGKQHLDARNLAGTKLPNDPTLASRAFSGFVLIPQMLNIWDSLNVEDMIKLVRLHCEKYKIDQNRIYIHGLSIGGYATYEAIKRAPWLFAAALPMSAVREAGNIFKHNQQNKVVHLPLWIFQGATDKEPSPTFTQSIVTKFKNAGAVVRYTVYASTGHNVWNKAYGEPEFFSWMKSKNKANLHPFKGITTIVKSKSQYPKLMLAEGFLAYQWEKNGVILSGKSNTMTITSPGKYRARFSRLSSAPTAAQWNRWSDPITITESTTATASVDSVEYYESQGAEETFSMTVYPNPAHQHDLNIEITTNEDGPIQVEIFDQLGRKVHQTVLEVNDLTSDEQFLPKNGLPEGVYIVVGTQGRRQVKQRVVIEK